MRQPELPNPPQPLKLRRIDQSDQEPPLSRISLNAYDVVYRIAVYSFRQIPAPFEVAAICPFFLDIAQN
jgi:hypothetical protein